MSGIKVIIAGGREFDNYEALCEVADFKLSDKLSDMSDIEIVSGTAIGADLLGERYAMERGYRIKRFPADWNKFGLSAGYKRNEEMAIYADALIAFWDGKSKGTKHMIELARKHKIKIKVVLYGRKV